MDSTNKLFGLILSGGRSTRMGNDKGLISYHGLPQREYLYQLAANFCEDTFLSIRAEQEKEIGAEFNFIIDISKTYTLWAMKFMCCSHTKINVGFV